MIRTRRCQPNLYKCSCLASTSVRRKIVPKKFKEQVKKKRNLEVFILKLRLVENVANAIRSVSVCTLNFFFGKPAHVTK